MLRRILAGVAFTAVLSGNAVATDLPARAPVYKAASATSFHDWTGFYAGGYAGYGWGKTTDNVGPNGFTPGIIRESVDPDPSGFAGGLQAGYNFQADRLLLGWEADIAAANIDGHASLDSPSPSNVTNADQRLNWFGTARMRLGIVPEQQWLFYATGGFAFGGGKVTTNIITDSGNCGVGICEYGSGSKTLTGWTIGGGLEYALLNNWSIKAEYLYYDLGRISHGSTDINSGVTDFHPAADFTGNLVKLGLNYKFGAPN